MTALLRHAPDDIRRIIDGHRHYMIPGVDSPVPSVTTILARAFDIESSFAYQVWREQHEAVEVGLADVARDIAAERGTVVHEHCTRVLVEGLDPEAAAHDGWTRSLVPVLRQWSAVAELALADGAVWHAYDRYAGTLDFALWIARRLRIWDLKTAKRRRTRAELARAIAQLGGYVEAFRWTYGLEVESCGLVIALPDEPAQVEHVTTEEAVSAWYEALARFNLHD